MENIILQTDKYYNYFEDEQLFTNSIDNETVKTNDNPELIKDSIKIKKSKNQNQNLYKTVKQQMIKENKNVSEDQLKKMVQVLRNRASAQKSRDNRKIYIQNLEEENQQLKNQLQTLQNDFNQLKQNCRCSVIDQDIFDDEIFRRNNNNKMSLMFIAITCIICCFCLIGEKKSQERVLAIDFKKDINIEYDLADQLNYINKQNAEFPITYSKAIIEYSKWQKIKESFESKFIQQEQQKFLPIAQNLNQIQPYHEFQQIQVSQKQIFCETPIIMGNKEKIKEDDWIKIYFPQNNLKYYDQNNQTLSQDQRISNNILQEFVCQVHKNII